MARVGLLLGTKVAGMPEGFSDGKAGDATSVGRSWGTSCTAGIGPCVLTLVISVWVGVKVGDCNAFKVCVPGTA
jgi:hypothetical protein